jgi:hypothetical protein
MAPNGRSVTTERGAVCHRSVNTVGPKSKRLSFIPPPLSSQATHSYSLRLTSFLFLFISLPPPPSTSALAKPWITLPHRSGISPVPPMLSPKFKTTTFSLSFRSNSTRTHPLPVPIQYPMTVSTLPRSAIYQCPHHPLPSATTVAPALPAQPIMRLHLVDSQPIARPSKTVTNSSARQV